MYPNLRAEMARERITALHLSSALGISNSTLSQKINGKYAFTLDEAKAIKNLLKSKLTVEELFEPEEA